MTHIDILMMLAYLLIAVGWCYTGIRCRLLSKRLDEMCRESGRLCHNQQVMRQAINVLGQEIDSTIEIEAEEEPTYNKELN